MQALDVFERTTKRFTTPPPYIAHNGTSEVQTPLKAAIQGMIYYLEKKGYEYEITDIAREFRTSRPTIYKILRSKTPFRPLHEPDASPSSRHRPLKLHRSDTAAMASYLDTEGFDART
jgi:hypothetical protein